MKIIKRTKESHKVLEIEQILKIKFIWEREETTVDINQKAIPLSEWVQKIVCLGKAKVLFHVKKSLTIDRVVNCLYLNTVTLLTLFPI